MTAIESIDGEGRTPGAMSLGSSFKGDEIPLTPPESSPIESSHFSNKSKGSILKSSEEANPIPATEVSNLVKLAQLISKETEKLDSYMRDNGLPSPTFDVEGTAGFSTLPEDILKSRQAIVHATSELKELVVGPTESLRWMAWDVSIHDSFSNSILILLAQ